MKSNQKARSFVEDESAIAGFVIAMLIVVLVASSVIGTIAKESQDAENSSDTDDKTDSIIDLWPFMVAIGVLLVIVKVAT